MTSKSKFAKAVAAVAGLSMAFSAILPASAVTVADLQAQIAMLMAQLSTLQGGSTASVTFTRDLTVGSSGSDVTALQQVLVSKGYLTMPAGTAFGYFGGLTKAAVARWQAASGISPAAGYFGAKSRLAFAAAGGTTTGGTTVGGTTTGGTVTGGVTGTITTPGAEGTIAVTSAPISNNTVYENDKMDPILAFNVKASGSDVAVQRVNVVLGNNTTVQFSKIYQTLYIVDDSGRTLGSIDMNSTNVTKQSNNDYMATISGFSSVVPKGTQRTYTVKADIRSTIDTATITANPSGFVVTLPVNGVRAVDGAGIDLYGPSSILTSSVIAAKSLVAAATLTVSTDSNNPNAQEVIASTGSANNQLDNQPVLVFDVKADKDDIKITDVNNVTLTATTGLATASTTRLYVGNGTSGQLLGTAAAAAAVSSFNNLSYTIPKGTTAVFTIATDVRSASTTGTVLAGSIASGSILGTNSVGDTITSTGTATGNSITVRSIGPVFTLAGTPTITKNAAQAIAGATSSAIATFNITIKAVGGDIWFGPQASTTFTFGIYQGGVLTTLNVASTTSWSVPSSGVVTSGTGVTPGGFKLQQNNSVTIPVTFYFEGRQANSTLVTSGTYAVGLESVKWSIIDGSAGNQKTTNFMSGRIEWRTTEVILP